jgi:Bacteriophage replication gene A protein (GPA)
MRLAKWGKWQTHSHFQNYPLDIGMWRRNPDASATSITYQLEPKLNTLPPAIQRQVDWKFFHEHANASDWPTRYRLQWKLHQTVQAFINAKLNIAFDYSEIEEEAEHKAEVCQKLDSLPAVENYCHQLGFFPPPETAVSTDGSRLKRTQSAKWWRKSIKAKYTREAENHLRAIGMIERGRELYCSNLALAWYKSSQAAQAAYLKSRTIECEGVQLELWDVAQKSLSNKSNRRTELMTRMRGFEDYAKQAGHVATFFTLTAPSAFHARAVGRGHNELFDGATVRDAQAWLSKIWARVRAALKKRGITIYGFRVAEPHHDGTPHWHLVLFCAPDHRDTLCELLREYWLSEYADEPGALVHRTAAKCIDEHKGSATGYLAKYIAKNIDGFGLDAEVSDEDVGTKIQDSALRVTAWASLHGIRQFQQIGGPAVTVYRELRRQRTPVNLRSIEPAREAADNHQWGRFITLNGGIELGRRGRLRAWTERTGEINGYGECRGPEIVGVMSVSEALQTRTQQWRIVRKIGAHSADSAIGKTGPDGLFKNRKSGAIGSGLSSESALGPVSITVAGAVSLSDPHGWTNPNETSMYGPN